jgi:hypothetical protein
MSPAEIPAATEGSYPLTTRLRDGSSVTVEEAYLAPRLQEALAHLEEQEAVATLLLCAGTFAHLRGTRPLFKPFAVGCDLLRQLGLRSIGLIAPYSDQEDPIRRRWKAAGFEPIVWTADLALQDDHFYRRLNENVQANALECLVLDYVGHPGGQVNRLQEGTQLPVLDLGESAMTALASAL